MDPVNPKTIIALVVGFTVIISANAFLAVRDSKLFDAYETRKEKYCAELGNWHPDCKVE